MPTTAVPVSLPTHAAQMIASGMCAWIKETRSALTRRVRPRRSRVTHATEILGTHVGSDSFVVEMRHDVTPHATKVRNQWSEAAVYRVRNGTIVEVRFYYKPPEG